MTGLCSVGTKPRVGKPRVDSGSGFGGGSGGPDGGFVIVAKEMAKPLTRPLRRNHRQDHEGPPKLLPEPTWGLPTRG